MTYLLLFYEFFKTGLFAVGGGLATLPFIYDIAVRYPEWINMNDISNMIAVSESTPRTYGCKYGNIHRFHNRRSIRSSLSYNRLSSTVCYNYHNNSSLFKKFEESQIVQDIFYGLRPAVAGLIAVAAYQVIKVTILTLIYTMKQKIL